MSILQELENKRDLALKGQEIPKTDNKTLKIFYVPQLVKVWHLVLVTKLRLLLDL